MPRSWSFWIVIVLIAAGVAVTAALGVFARPVVWSASRAPVEVVRDFE